MKEGVDWPSSTAKSSAPPLTAKGPNGRIHYGNQRRKSGCDVHLAACSTPGRDPRKSSDSAERIVSNDRLSALIAAREGMPQNFGFCSFCQREFQAVLKTLLAD
jgi:hypothetical protein